MPRLASWPWRTIFWPARSVASAMRAQNDDRPDAWAADRAPGAAAGLVAFVGVLPAAADAGSRLGIDAAHRRAASGAPVRGCADAARHAAPGGISGRSQAGGHADREDGYRGALPAPQHQPPPCRPPSPSLSAAWTDHRPAEPGLGDGHHLYPDAARVRIPDGGAGLGHPPGPGVAAVDQPRH